MTNDETIRKVAEVLTAHPSIPNHKDAAWDVCPSCPDADVAGPNSPSHAAHQARALAEAGLLAPAPLTEEWAVEGTLDSGDDWIADVEFATRLGAEDFLESNEWARRDGGHISRRYVSDWETP